MSEEVTPHAREAAKQKRRHKHPFGDKPSEIVAAFIRFDEYQQHLHSWHTLQDCLDALRKWEADNEAKTKSAIDAATKELSDQLKSKSDAYDALLVAHGKAMEERLKMEEQVATLSAQKSYYESVLTYDTSKLLAIPHHPNDPVKAVESERVANVIRERDELRAALAAKEGK